MTSRDDVKNFVEALRGMIKTQKDYLISEFDRDLDLARHELTELLEKAMSAKEQHLNALAHQLQASNQSLDRLKLSQSHLVQSLTCLKYKRTRSTTPGCLRSLGYVQCCKSAPGDVRFVEDYSSVKFKKNNQHQLFYSCGSGYDPCLMSFIRVAVTDESNKELNVSNTDLKDGTYMMEFVAGKAGVYSVHVALYGQDIRGSPLRIEVSDDSVARGSEPQAFRWEEPGAGDGPSQSGQPQMRRATWESSGEVSQKREMWESGCGRRSAEQPPMRFATQEAKQEAPLQFREMRPKLSDLAASVNIRPNTASPQAQTVGGFPTMPTVGGHTPAPKPLERNLPSEACSKVKAPFPKPAEVPRSESIRARTDFCSPECFEIHEKEHASNRNSLNSSMSAKRYSALPGESMPKADPPKMNTKPVAKASTKKGSFSAELVIEFQGFRRKKFWFPIGVTATAQNVVILTDTGNDQVLMFNSEARPLGQAVLPESLGGFDRPSAVVAQEDGTFAVKDDRCIYIFSKEGEFIRALGKGSLSRPYGLALHKSGDLLTLSLGDSPPRLRSYCMSGNFDRSVPYGPLMPLAPRGSKCRFMDVHGDELFVSDLGLSRIYKTSLLGETVKTFGDIGHKPGMLNEPSGLSATEDYLFVGDSKNNRVQVFDLDGNFVSVVKMESPVVRPSGIYVSPTNTLYVVNYLNAALGIYQLTFQEEP